MKNIIALFLIGVLSSVVAADPQVGFTATVVDAAEATASTQVVLTITRDVATTAITVGFTVDDTVSPVGKRASVGSDYSISPVLSTPPIGEVAFAIGVFSRTIMITINNDGGIEGEEFIRVRLTSGIGYTINGAVSSVQVTIADNDLIATVFNDFPGASEDPVLTNGNSGHDPGDARRGRMRVQFNAATLFDKNLQATFIGTALINTDYALTYKIGGNSMDAGLGFTTTASYPVGTDEITVQGGLGASASLAVGDVFTFPSPSTARHVITDVELDMDDLPTGVIRFRRYSGGIVGTTGLDVAVAANTTLNTIFSSTSPIMNIAVPRESTRVEFGVTPGGTTGPANDGLVEGAEYVTMIMASSNDYAFGDPDTGAVTIADVDSTASIALTANAVERDIPGTFTVSLTPPFSRSVTVFYSITGTAGVVDYEMAGANFTTWTGSVVVPASGSATITVEPLGTYIPPAGRTVTLTITGSADYKRADGVLSSSSATMTILPTTGTVSVAKTADGTEGGSDGAFTVTLVRFSGHDEAVNVGYTIAGSSTASAGSDYTTLSGSVVIAANATTATIPVLVTNDTLAEDDETVSITLSSGSTYQLAGTASATATIQDDEPTISVSASTNATEGGTAGTFTFSYPAPARTIAYNVTFVLSGTAVSPTDYTTTTPTTITIPANEREAAVSITAVDNLVAHTPARQVTLTITPPGASGTFHVGTSTRTLSIVENEPGASVSAASGATATEGGSTASFTITLTSAAPTGGLTIPYTFSGAATTDYSASPTTQAVIAAGNTTAQVTITAIDNAVTNGTRTVTLTLATPASPAVYVLGTATASLALADNDIGVTEVSSTALDGTYALSDTVPLTVTFDGAVTVSGIPTLTLATGTARQASYVSGSGSATLTFSYVVQANDVSSDLDYASTSALSGTITKSGGSVVLTLPTPGAAGSLGANKALVIDGSLTGGKPAPGVVSNGTGGGCGLGSGFATLVGLFMLAGFALSIRRNRA